MESDKIAQILHDARTKAGMSQDELAQRLKVSRKTIQNWETGIGSPSLLFAINLFSALGIQPVPLFLKLIHQESEQESVEDALIDAVKELSPDLQRKLLFCIGAEHGSSPIGIIEMLTTYLQLPLEYRLTICTMIMHQYELCAQTGKASDKMTPDIHYIRQSIIACTDAVIKGRKEYNSTKED